MILQVLEEESNIRKIFIKFLKDERGYIAAYSLSFFLILLFYSISTNHSVEIIYPMTISIFILIVFLFLRWLKYYDISTKLSKCKGKEVNLIKGYSEEEKEFERIIRSLEKEYVEEISRIKSDNLKDNKFISQWIHNMKTPVSVIDLVTQRIKLNEITMEEGIESINEENSRLLVNLEQVLNLLRLEDFSRDYVPESINLVELLREVINEKKNQFIYNNVYPKLESEYEEIEVFTDSKWNRVMLDQLISNAIKYSCKKNERKYVYFNFEKVGEEVILIIRDEGVGIPDYDIGRIFDPFFTGENGRSFKNSSGIGLFICKEISRKLNHKISISSNPGVGTTVKINYLSKL